MIIKIIITMKQIAGSLKLELAIYQEVEFFAKFGSDLNEGALKQLHHGSQLVRAYEFRK
jgi:F-type H+/Na+-transporting ATPase subunit alpha